MAKEKFKYGELTVEIRDVGEGVAPWDEREEVRHEYDVTVKGAGGNYKSKAWGSTNDFEKGPPVAHRSLAQMVVGELVSARSDPDEFINMLVEGAEGRDALDKGKVAEKVIKAAERFDEDALFAAGDAAREEEESGVS